MNKILNDTLTYYCELEMSDFTKSPVFVELNECVKANAFFLHADFGATKDKKDKNLYVSVSVVDNNDTLIECCEGGLTTATMLIFVDAKERCKFFSWQDDEFINDLKWIIRQLKLRTKLMC